MFGDIQKCKTNHDNHDDKLFFTEDIIQQYCPDLAYVFKEASLEAKDNNSIEGELGEEKSKNGDSQGNVSLYSSDDSKEHWVDHDNDDYSPNNEKNEIKVDYSDKLPSRNSSIKSKKLLDMDLITGNKNAVLSESKNTGEDINKDRSIMHRDIREDSQNMISENSQKFINESSKSRENKSESNNIKTSQKDEKANFMYEPIQKSKFGQESDRIYVKAEPPVEQEPVEKFSYNSNLDQQSIHKEKEYGKIAISIVSTKTIQANEDLRNIIEDLETQKEILLERIEKYERILNQQKESKVMNGSTTKTSNRRSSIRDSYDLYRILQNKEMAVNKMEGKLRNLETNHKIMVNKDGVEREIAETDVKTDARNFKNTTLSQSIIHSNMKTAKRLNRKVRDFSNERSGSRFVNDLVNRINTINSNRKTNRNWQ